VVDDGVWSTGGMIVTGENTSTWRKTNHTFTSSTTNFTWTGLVMNPGFRDETHFNYLKFLVNLLSLL
jgi:hypothetical protein